MRSHCFESSFLSKRERVRVIMGGGSSKSSSKRTTSNVSTSSRLSSRSTPQHANVVKLDGAALFKLVCDEKEFKPLCMALYRKYERERASFTCVYGSTASLCVCLLDLPVVDGDIRIIITSLLLSVCLTLWYHQMIDRSTQRPICDLSDSSSRLCMCMCVCTLYCGITQVR